MAATNLSVLRPLWIVTASFGPTPLTVIKGYVYTLHRAESDPAKAAKLDVINGECERLGYLIALAGNHLKTAEVFSGILVIGVIGLVTDAFIRLVNGWLFPWREARDG